MADRDKEQPTGRRADWYPLVGVITSAGFASGDRFVCGTWDASPLGPIADLMWATPDGRRRLVAPTEEVAAFVSAVYRFDDVVVTRFSAAVNGRSLVVSAPLLGLSLELRAGRGWPLPPAPAWAVRYVAGPLAWRLLRVRTYGVTPTGVREWYRARWYRPLVEGRASLEGRDLGPLGPVDPRVNFGFSEPPRRPSMVWVRPLLHDPTGELARVVRRGSGDGRRAVRPSSPGGRRRP